MSSSAPNVNASPLPGGGFGTNSTGVPRAPQVLSTNAPHTFHTYTIPNCAASPSTSACYPHGIAVGPDRLYYTLNTNNAVGSVSYAGDMGPQIAAPGNPNDIVEGENGGMYVALSGGSTLGELAEDGFGGSIFGSWNDFDVTSHGTNGVASDANGVLWYAETNNGSVVRMTTYGSLLSRTALTPGGVPGRVASGANGKYMYVTENQANKIAKLDLTGKLISEISITQGSGPEFITAGQDGNMYFSEWIGSPGTCGGSGYIGKIAPDDTLTMIPVPACAVLGIASGYDGNIWFLEHLVNKIAEFNLSTQSVTEYALPSGLDHPYALASGADGQLWFTTQNSPYVTSFQP